MPDNTPRYPSISLSIMAHGGRLQSRMAHGRFGARAADSQERVFSDRVADKIRISKATRTVLYPQLSHELRVNDGDLLPDSFDVMMLERITRDLHLRLLEMSERIVQLPSEAQLLAIGRRERDLSQDLLRQES